MTALIGEFQFSNDIIPVINFILVKEEQHGRLEHKLCRVIDLIESNCFDSLLLFRLVKEAVKNQNSYF